MRELHVLVASVPREPNVVLTRLRQALKLSITATASILEILPHQVEQLEDGRLKFISSDLELQAIMKLLELHEKSTNSGMPEMIAETNRLRALGECPECGEVPSTGCLCPGKCVDCHHLLSQHEPDGCQSAYFDGRGPVRCQCKKHRNQYQ